MLLCRANGCDPIVLGRQIFLYALRGGRAARSPAIYDVVL